MEKEAGEREAGGAGKRYVHGGRKARGVERDRRTIQRLPADLVQCVVGTRIRFELVSRR